MMTTKTRLYIVNTYFQNQIQMNETQANLPNALFDNDWTHLEIIIITPLKVKSVLQKLKVGKASCADKVNNILLKEQCYALSNPLCNLIYPWSQVLYQIIQICTGKMCFFKFLQFD